MERHLTFFTTDPPFTLDWEDGEATAEENTGKHVLTNPALAQGDRFVCSQCGADITRSSQRIAVGGSHRHTVPSSFGLDQEIGCFSLAPGCTVLGHFAMDFGKPADGQWQMGICSTCGYHLGWHHQTADGIGFYGLLLDHLALAPDDSETDPA
ncbi:hypothetical protein DFW101_0548 [Solidesulfovibrio carbinoliphilus subsp. oakridgensis]|uniref:CULT domain-containing protein n=1 Tax=Solidesulfovibrio carbinoliphilus subsp. oakridgensis TaxID=694327 RepID=G7QDQ9_9BACT|nr:cereblon family protein [Solidesulfovibrio carbinoliphilus]EHJ46565.1 hypothetical protein DFW101_0548 [Solidesulfovibrio carbinoliphilus subsp. oakridgensis]